MGFSFDPSQWGNDLTQAGEALGQVTLAVVTAGGSVIYETIAGKPPAQWIQALGSEAIAICNIFGFVGTNVELTFFIEALQGKFSTADLWNALKKDYDNFTAAKDAAVDITDDGDYTKAWNLVTDNGQDAIALADQLKFSLPTPTPDPAFSGPSLYSAAMAGQTDMRLAAQLLFDHGYYTQGNALLAKWRTGLINSPLGAVLAANSALATGDPLTMLSLAGHLTAAETNPIVTGQWTSAKWGLVALTFDPIIQRLKTSAAAAVQAKLGDEQAIKARLDAINSVQTLVRPTSAQFDAALAQARAEFPTPPTVAVTAPLQSKSAVPIQNVAAAVAGLGLFAYVIKRLT